MVTKKKKSESTLSVLVEGQAFIVETVDGKEVSESEIDQHTVGVVLRDYVERAISKFCDELKVKVKAKVKAKKTGKKK